MYMIPASLIPGYHSNIILTDVAGYYLEQELSLRRHKRKAENKTGTLKRQLPILKKKLWLTGIMVHEVTNVRP